MTLTIFVLFYRLQSEAFFGYQECSPFANFYIRRKKFLFTNFLHRSWHAMPSYWCCVSIYTRQIWQTVSKFVHKCYTLVLGPRKRLLYFSSGDLLVMENRNWHLEKRRLSSLSKMQLLWFFSWDLLLSRVHMKEKKCLE